MGESRPTDLGRRRCRSRIHRTCVNGWCVRLRLAPPAMRRRRPLKLESSSAIRWVAQFRQNGSLAAKPMGGKRSPLDAHKDWLLKLIAAEPDLTLQEIRGRLAGGASWLPPVRCGGSATATASRSKKSLHAAEQDRDDVRMARANWKQEQPRLDPHKLVFIDETGASTNMTRLRGRAGAENGSSPKFRRATEP